MTDQTIGIIGAIKQSGLVWNRAVAEYMSETTGTPAESYTETDLNQILKSALVDYISTCDRPGDEVRDLLDMMESSGSHSIGYHIANLLGIAQVREGGEYVNGFRDLG